MMQKILKFFDVGSFIFFIIIIQYYLERFGVVRSDSMSSILSSVLILNILVQFGHSIIFRFLGFLFRSFLTN